MFEPEKFLGLELRWFQGSKNLDRSSSWQLTRTVGTVLGAVAAPHGWNAVGIVALELIGPAGVIAIHFIRAEGPVDRILAVIVSVAKPGERDAFAISALERRCRARLSIRNGRSTRRARSRPRTGTVLLVRVVPAIVGTVANPRRMNASRRVGAILQLLSWSADGCKHIPRIHYRRMCVSRIEG